MTGTTVCMGVEGGWVQLLTDTCMANASFMNQAARNARYTLLPAPHTQGMAENHPGEKLHGGGWGGDCITFSMWEEIGPTNHAAWWSCTDCLQERKQSNWA
jgi:hypothetical protein